MNATETKHSPTPWTHQPGLLLAADGHEVASLFAENFRGNSEFIVRAVNSHERLLAACKAAEDALSGKHFSDRTDTDDIVLDELRNAIAAAE
jgi:hypothetical protein